MREPPAPSLKRALLWLLAKLSPEDWAEDIVQDMVEAHAQRRGAGTLGADLWLAGQVALFAGRFLFERISEALSLSAAERRFDMVRADVRHTFRSIRRAPLFYGAVVVTLAVGIGPNTAIFSVVNSALLNPLPYPDSDRLVALTPNPWVPNGITLGVQGAGLGIDELAAFYPQSFAVILGGRAPDDVEGAQVTHDYLDLFRAGMALGRGFRPGDAEPGAVRTAIITHGAWVRWFGGDPEALGQVIEVNGDPHQVIGVTERGFRTLAPRTEDPELWIPFEVLPETADGSPPWTIPLARIGGSGSMDVAQRELLEAIALHEGRNPDPEEGSRAHYRWAPLESLLTGDIRAALIVLQLSVGVLLLLASINVANLLLVRFSSRQSEIALRTALGASRGRVFGRLLTEGLVISALGAGIGLVLMQVCVDLVFAVAPDDVRRVGTIGLDTTVLLFTLIVSTGSGLFFAIIPALAGTRQSPHQLLKQGGRTTAGSRSKHRVSQSLVIGEVMLTLVLVVVATMLVRTFFSLSTQAPGFRTEDVVAVSLRVPANRYPTVPELDGFYGQMVERMGTIPGATAVGLSNNLPISRGGATRAYGLPGDSREHVAQYGVVSAGYFRALEIPLLSGRYLNDGDREGAIPVAVVDESMARDAWPGEDPVRRRFRLDNGSAEWLTVVGVVGDILGNGLARDAEPGFYLPHLQRPDTPTELAVGHNVVFLVATRSPLEVVAPALRAAVWQVDPSQPVAEVMTLGAILGGQITPERFRAMLMAAFAAIGLVLAIAGMYGVIGQLLADRAHEFGIRQAMGATRSDLVRRVLGWGMGLTAAGVALGIGGALVVSRFLTGLLFGVTPTEPWVFAASAAVVAVISLSACVAPAVRATRTTAVAALRSGD